MRKEVPLLGGVALLFVALNLFLNRGSIAAEELALQTAFIAFLLGLLVLYAILAPQERRRR